MQRTPFTGDTATQMHFARKGTITPEMTRVALREGVEPEFIRSEVARGRMVIPANVNHAALDPMGIGINALCKINANIGNSSVHSNVDQELTKLHQAVHFGERDAVEISWNRLFQCARRYREPERRVGIAPREGAVDQARGEAVAAADPIDEAHDVALALIEAP